MIILVLSTVVVTYSIYWLFFKRDKHLPPGPIGVPILGYVPFMSFTTPEVSLTALKEKYGDMFTVAFGMQDVVVINEGKLLREVYSSAQSSAKYEKFNDSIFSEIGEPCGIFFTSGEKWKKMRRFCVRKLNDLGMTRRNFDDMIGVEVDKLLDRLDTMQHKPLNITHVFMTPLLNILWNVVAGEKFSFEDPSVKVIHKEFLGYHEALFPLTFLTMMPKIFFWICIPLQLFGYHHIVKTKKWFAEYIKKHHESSKTAGFPKNLLDEFIKDNVMETEADTKRETPFLLADLFSAATDTSNSTMGFVIHCLITRQDIQDKIRQEIESQVGLSEKVLYDHATRLPYTMAFLSEVQRTANITPMGTMHRLTGPLKVRGYVLPENTLVTANFHAIHNDPNYWDHPDQFNPERFLDDGRNYKENKDSFLPFSVGKRHCPGEEIAKAELFLLLTRMIQRFNVAEVRGRGLPKLERTLSLIVRPKSFEFCLERVKSA